MSKAEPAATIVERIEWLRGEIRRHDHLYYVENQPALSDQQYDALLRELRDLEERNPSLVTPGSPTQRVGETPLEGFAHIAHAIPMLSIDNTYSPDELREFDERVGRALEDESYEYAVDPKVDGVAVALRYEAGLLKSGATRGDGQTGDDITQNIRTLGSVPLRLHGECWPDVLEVRGEVYWPRPAFDRTNRAREEAGDPPFANPRNATAGTLKSLDSKVVAGRGLAFVAHGIGVIDPFPPEIATHTALFERLRAWGLPTSPHTRLCKSIDDVIDFIADWDRQRGDLDYDTDGMVAKIDRFDQREILGATSRAPRWCIAFKYAAEQAQTRLVSVDFKIGKLGTITPRANLEPVQLAGTTVSHATLHNFDQVRRLDLHLGDTVTVEKAGEIIPQVVAVDANKRDAAAKPIVPPDSCPACGDAVVQDEGGVYLRCINPACPAQLVERLRYFCGRDQMDIEGAGAILVEMLVKQNLVSAFGDLYRLHEHRKKLIDLERMGEKSVDNLLAGIEASKARPLARVLAALNIRHIGANTAELLADHFATMGAVAAASTDALKEVDGIGPEMASSLRQWFDSPHGTETIADLESVGVNMTQPHDPKKIASPIQGKTLVVTGTLERFTRNEIKSLIKRLGAKAATSVSKKTDYLVAGADAGSKLAKAQKLGVTILDENAFADLVKTD